VLIELNNTQLPVIPAARQTSTLSDPNDATAFEEQLSSALAESLEKLGVGKGEVNITIRNPTATTRQIMVTYSLDGSSVEPAASSDPAPSAAPSAGLANPFSGYIAHQAQEVMTPKPDPAEWSPYDSPRDVRDQIGAGGGKTTASGSPLIQNNDKGAANQYGYAGPATLNPYFTTPSNPLRDGYVVGFRNWFADAMILGGLNGPIPANKMQYSTEEGAQEALRIVKQFEPAASVVQSMWQSGPFAVDKPIFEIELGGGRRLNAGGVLCGYYNQGYGVTISSDETIRRGIQLA
jgi:hypothetical protein